jgi:hypothetical protein
MRCCWVVWHNFSGMQKLIYMRSLFEVKTIFNLRRKKDIFAHYV